MSTINDIRENKHISNPTDWKELEFSNISYEKVSPIPLKQTINSLILSLAEQYGNSKDGGDYNKELLRDFLVWLERR